jgi:DNA-binding transcriptional MerR regulator
MTGRSDDYLRTHQVAGILGIPKRTLTHRVRIGLYPEPKQSESGYYLWTQHDIKMIQAVVLDRNARGG